MSVLLTILGISLLIVLHELGHYGVARACGMRVLRFSFGFGPTLVSKQWGDTIWQIAVIPLGGYVHVHGMGPDEPVGTDGKSFRDKPVWQRALVIFAGPAANWLIAAACITLLAASVGFREYDETRPMLGELTDDGAGTRDGLREGDVIESIAGVAVHDWNGMVTEVRKHPEEAVPFVVQRGTVTSTLTVKPDRGDGDVGVLGVLPPSVVHHFGPGEAVAAGFSGAWKLTRNQASLLVGMVTGSKKGKILALPEIVKTVAQEAERGLNRLFESLALLSIGLCLLNLLPVPALDGSRLLFLGIEAARGRPVSQLIEGYVHAAGFVMLLGLMLFLTVRSLL